MVSFSLSVSIVMILHKVRHKRKPLVVLKLGRTSVYFRIFKAGDTKTSGKREVSFIKGYTLDNINPTGGVQAFVAFVIWSVSNENTFCGTKTKLVLIVVS